MIEQKKLIAICFDAEKKAYKYQYKLIKNSKGILSFEQFCRRRGFIYVNYYEKDTGQFYKRTNLNGA
jgi:hypothetical protein